MPSVSPWVTVSCLLPQPPTATAQRAARIAVRRVARRIRAGIVPAAGLLQPGDRGARAAVLVLLEDRLQALERPAAAAPIPAAQPEPFHDPVGEQRGLRLGHVLHARPVAVGGQRPAAEGLVAVELAAAARRDD